MIVRWNQEDYSIASVIRDYAQKVNINPDDVTDRLNQLRQSKVIGEYETLVSAIAQDEDRLKMLGKMFAQLYEDRLMGSISEENFDMMRNKTQRMSTYQKRGDHICIRIIVHSVHFCCILS